jgi:hypothetical protein
MACVCSPQCKDNALRKLGGWGDNATRNHEDRMYGCAKAGCHAVNDPSWAYGAYGKSWCLHHPPLRIKIRRWLYDHFDIGREV